MNKQWKILLVEDEVLIAEMYEVAFAERGYLIEVASDGEQALEKLNNPQNHYDLVLLDILLPKVDGIKVLKQIKQEGSSLRQVPVVLLTNLGTEVLIEEAMDLGADRYIIKSQNIPDDIVDEVERFLSFLSDNKNRRKE